MKRAYWFFVSDIIKSIEKIEEFLEDMSFVEFSEDDKTGSAVIKKLEIIGEASKNIPENIKLKYDNVPWKEMAVYVRKRTFFCFRTAT